MPVLLKRAYEEPSADDGYRVLVDRIWPRGISREDLKADDWLRQVAPSPQLRKGFHSGELSWDEFRRGYLTELKDCRDILRPLAERASRDTVTL
ncbi:MAG: DUF488 domain-containing protein, partial [Marinobacter sp.]